MGLLEKLETMFFGRDAASWLQEAIATSVRAHTRGLAAEIANEIRRNAAEQPARRLCGVLVFGELWVPTPRDESEPAPEDDPPFPPVRRRHVVQPRQYTPRPFIASSSLQLIPSETHVLRFQPHARLSPGALVVSWGACCLTDVIVGTRACAPWPGESPAFITADACNVGMLITAHVRGWER